MYLFLLENKNLLLGGMPETLGLLLFGIALIVTTVGLRWFFDLAEKKETAKANLENFTRENNG